MQRILQNRFYSHYFYFSIHWSRVFTNLVKQLLGTYVSRMIMLISFRITFKQVIILTVIDHHWARSLFSLGRLHCLASGSLTTVSRCCVLPLTSGRRSKRWRRSGADSASSGRHGVTPRVSELNLWDIIYFSRINSSDKSMERNNEQQNCSF